MNFIDLLRREATVRFGFYVCVAVVLALSDMTIVIIINHVLMQDDIATVPLWHIGVFALLVATRKYTQEHLIRVGGNEIMRIIHSVRVRIIDKVRRVDVKSMELTDQSSLLIGTIANVSSIGYLSFYVPLLFKCIIQILFLLIYIYFISATQFVVAAVAVMLIVLSFWEGTTKIQASMKEMQASDEAFLSTASEMMEGFKEVKMNRWRSDALVGDITEVSAANLRANSRLREDVLKDYGWSELLLACFIGALVFVEPKLIGTSTQTVMQVAVAALFIASLTRDAITTGTEVIILKSVCGGLMAIERTIDQLRSDEPAETPPLWSAFKTLEFRQITYDNIDALAKARFTVGPFDLTIKPGEIVFLTGSNGSGKSSVLRLIAGLYPPHRGDVLVDGHALKGDQFVQYRSLISCIFAEHYLFHKLYGFEVDPVRAKRLIGEMGLTGKTELVDGTFSTLALSSGQRTRIAMVAALLEDRPIYLFDEWAADQDPGFRHRFYREILPQLKAAGKAVIAITHDSEYFRDCDRLYDVQRGRLVEITRMAVGASL